VYLIERKAHVIEERKRQAEEAARKERERVELEAKKRCDALVEDVRSWRMAAEIRAYVEARLAKGTNDTVLNEWATWALGVAERIDPLRKSERPS
jgi:hypothetical protein